MDTGHRVDTLSNAERLSLRTNAVDWLLLVPNFGIEYDFGNLNYNRLSIGLNFRYNWQSSHTFKPGIVYNVAEIRAEVRNYYRIRLLSNYIETPKKKWQRLISPRKEVSRHPTTTYYWGGYFSYNNFALKLGKEGKQGNAMTGGVMWGMLKPLYEFSNGNSLDLEFAAAAGITYAKYDCFEHDSFNDYYPKTGHGSTIMPTINELRVGFVYRLGSYPITKKYRWRYDVDLQYQSDYDNMVLERRRESETKAFNDSVDAFARKLFWERYDSIAKVNKVANESIGKADGEKAKKLLKETVRKQQQKKANEALEPKKKGGAE